ncbi:MAG TPA: hypothetical protein VFA50_23190 [Stellaceae bacterium]|nr:hypothetical protein [Stellaceae bacterium]
MPFDFSAPFFRPFDDGRGSDVAEILRGWEPQPWRPHWLGAQLAAFLGVFAARFRR